MTSVVIPGYGAVGAGYVWPFAGSPDTSQYMRTDDGWDLQDTRNRGSNPVFAVTGPGKMQYGHNAPGFGDPYPIVILDTPIPTNAGRATGIYYGHTRPVVPEGSRVEQSQQIAITTNPSGGNAASVSGGGWLEIGFWGPGGPLGNGGEMKNALLGASAPTGGAILTSIYGATGGNNPDDNPAQNDPNTFVQGSEPFAPTDAAKQTNALGAIQNYVGDDKPDPRNNLPFCEAFLGNIRAIQGRPQGGLDYNTGSFRYPTPQGISPQGTVQPMGRIVRGGMSEILKDRPRGPFQAFFMVNPDGIAYSTGVSSSVVAPPATVPKSQQQIGAFITTMQSLNFTLLFNRMYEVWRGDVPGPSEEGTRWDVRAFERLMGMYDAQKTNTEGDATVTTPMPGWANLTGVSNNAPQKLAGQGLPLQLTFGGPNSIRLQGRITDFEYQYEKFDSNMIPITATISITFQALFAPPPNADLIAPLVQNTGDPGVISNNVPLPSTFNGSGPTILI